LLAAGSVVSANPTALVTSYALDHTDRYDVTAQVDADAFAITLERKDIKTNKLLFSQKNKQFLPLHDPYTGSTIQLQRLVPEVAGFTLVVSYQYLQGSDVLTATFTHRPELQLTYLRKERLDAQGLVQSGIVVDYQLMKGRWLGNPAQGPRATLPPFPMKKTNVQRFEALGSVFDFPAEADFPVKYGK
jgi:hypothetical protein